MRSANSKLCNLLFLALILWAAPSAAQQEIDASKVYLGAVTQTAGSGAPSASEPAGSIYFRTDTGQWYQRTSGGTWVTLTDSAGKIPAISSTYFTSLSGANLTALNATNVSSGNLAYARMPSGSGTWTATPTISGTLGVSGFASVGGVTINSTGPIVNWYETDAALDSKYWRVIGDSGAWKLQTVNDAYTVANTSFQITRAGAALFSGSGSFGSSLAVTGAVTGGTYNGQTISSAASLTGTLAVAGAATLSSTLGVTGVTTLSDHLRTASNFSNDIGTPTSQFRALHVGEIVAGTLVAQDVMATIGGAVLVGPTTYLEASLGSGSGDTSISVAHNEMAIGDRVFLQARGQLEWMAVTAGPTGTGPYTYTVTRDLDLTGRNAWLGGDAIVNTGATGDGFIDIYANSGVMTGSGPSIVGNVRTGTAYDALAPRWAIGNLDGVFGYSGTEYGLAAGDPDNAWIKVDPTNGVRLGHGITTNLSIDAAGNATFAGALSAATGSFSGAITSTSGTIGGWTLGATTLTGGNAILDSTGNLTLGTADNVLRASADDATYRLWIGDATAADAPFRVTQGGGVTMTDATINGGDITMTAASTAFSPPAALKFTRDGVNPPAAGDVFALYSYGNADQRLWLENTYVPTTVTSSLADVGSHVHLKATGWNKNTGVARPATTLELYSGVNNYASVGIGSTVSYHFGIASFDAIGTDADLGESLSRWGDAYLSGELYERTRTVAAGDWSSSAYSAANFTASTGTWTVDAGDVVTLAYSLVGDTMKVSGVIVNTSVSSPTANLQIAIPEGKVAAKRMDVMGYAVDNGGSAITTTNFVASGGTVITIARLDGANWSASITATNVVFSIEFEIQ